jgi:hypothetical protein
MRKFNIWLISSLLFCSFAVSAQNNDSLRVHRIIKMNPQHLLFNSLRLDLEFPLAQKKNGYGLRGQSIAIAPNLYRSRFRYTGYDDNRSTLGFGTDVYHKLYLSTNESNEFYLGYGLGVSYLVATYETQEFLPKRGDDGLLYYENETVENKQQLLRPNAFLIGGWQIDLGEVVQLEFYVGVGNRETIILNEVKNKKYFADEIVEPAYSGPYPMGGFRLGIKLRK